MWGRLSTCGGLSIRLPHWDAPAATTQIAATVCGLPGRHDAPGLDIGGIVWLITHF